MYTIGKVIWGYEIPVKLLKELETDGVLEDELISFGFTLLSHQDGETPVQNGFFGIDLGTLDALEPVRITSEGFKPAQGPSIFLEPSQKQMEAFQKLQKELPKELKSLLGKPGNFIIWATS